MLILNTPHNPSAKVLSRSEMLKLEELLRETSIILLSDEVYEHIVFDQHQHHSASAFPGLAERAVVCASFGKTFHNTGWKMGYCVAPAQLMGEIRKIQGALPGARGFLSEEAGLFSKADLGQQVQVGTF